MQNLANNQRQERKHFEVILYNKFEVYYCLDGAFAPIETRIFRTILSENCKPNPNKSPPQSPLVVDVGGNVGYFALYAASFGCRVITVEPNPDMVKHIKMSVKLNGFEDKIRVVNAAAGDQPGKKKKGKK